jgi:hypothetical protein
MLTVSTDDVRDAAARKIQRRVRIFAVRRFCGLLRATRDERRRATQEADAAAMIQRAFSSRLIRRLGLQRLRSLKASAAEVAAAAATVQERQAAALSLQQCARTHIRGLRAAPPSRDVDPEATQFAQVEQERSYAARIIQRYASQLAARAALVDALVARSAGQAAAAIVQEVAYQARAATVIQCQFRRLAAVQAAQRRRGQVAEQTSSLRRDEAQQVLQRTWRSFYARRLRLQWQDLLRAERARRWETEAAVMIQTTFRRVRDAARGIRYMAEEVARRRNRAATRIQCAWRAAVARMEFRERAGRAIIEATHDRVHQAAATIQSLARGRAARKTYGPAVQQQVRLHRYGRELVATASRIGRGFVVRRRLRVDSVRANAASTIQRGYRSWAALRRLQALRRIDAACRARAQRHAAATMIQRNVRRRIAAKLVAGLRYPPTANAAALMIQQAVRRSFAQRQLKALRVADEEAEADEDLGRLVTLTQARVRGYLARVRFEMVLDQRTYARRFVARCFAAYRCRRSLAIGVVPRRQEQAATRIQREYRRGTAKSQSQRQLAQRRLAVQIFQERLRAATLVQTQWRAFQARNVHVTRLELRRTAVCTVQALLRARRSENRAALLELRAKLNVAALVVQAKWRTSQQAVVERRTARELEAALVGMELTAVVRKETLDRHFLKVSEGNEWSDLIREQTRVGEAITKRLADREAAWLARTPAGTQLQAAKQMQASVRSFATRRRELLRFAPGDSDAAEVTEEGTSSNGNAQWLEWVRGQRQHIGLRASFDAERLLRSLSTARDQLSYEETALRGQLALQELHGRRERREPSPPPPPIAEVQPHESADRRLTNSGDIAASTTDTPTAVRTATADPQAVLDLTSASRGALPEHELRAVLRDAYHNPRIASVNLQRCQIKDASCADIAAFLTANPHVAHVDLRDNRISDVGASHLVAAISACGRHVYVDLGGNFATERYIAALRRVAGPTAGAVGSRRELRPLARARVRACAPYGAQQKVLRTSAPIPESAVPLIDDDDE